MNKSSGVSYLNPSSRQTTQENQTDRAAIGKICNEVSRDLLGMLQSMFDGIDDSFFELANSARTNNEQNRFFEAMREIRIKRKGIEADFISEIRASFSDNKVLKLNATPTTKPSAIDGLSLVKDEDLEEEVAITTMANKALSNFQGLILQVHTRIAKLYGTDELTQITPPLSPQSLCEAFSKACSELEIEIKERLIVYKQFDRYVMLNLEHIYKDVNKILINIGIMPNLKTPDIRQKHGPRSESASTPFVSSEGAKTGSGGLQEDQPKNIFPHLQSLLANIRSAGSRQPITGASANHQTYVLTTNDLISMLTDIQKGPVRASAHSDGASIIDIRSALEKELHQDIRQKEKSPSFSQIDEDLINLVSMLFEFILDDYNLAPPIQALISRLQIPILKVVIQDKSFFSSNLHPARQLLNSLARAGIGWGESQDKSKDTLYDKIHRTVHTILDEFDGNISLFEKLNKEFSEFIIKEERKAKIVEQRTKESEEGRIKSKQAQKTVENILSNRILNTRYPIPQVIIDTLKSGWSRVMFLSYLRDDKEHQWLDTIKVAEDLIWCAQPLSDSKDRQKWITIVPKLLKNLKSGLEEVSYKASELEETLGNIKLELTTAFKNSSFDNFSESDTVHKRVPVDLRKKAQLAEPTAVQKQIESKSSELDKYLKIIDDLATGTWVEFLLLNGNKFRCKLSTKIEEADCYIFVNRMGLKTVEKSRVELAEDLRKAQVVILEQGLMIDRAMNALMSSLRQKANA